MPTRNRLFAAGLLSTLAGLSLAACASSEPDTDSTVASGTSTATTTDMALPPPNVASATTSGGVIVPPGASSTPGAPSAPPDTTGTPATATASTSGMTTGTASTSGMTTGTASTGMMTDDGAGGSSMGGESGAGGAGPSTSGGAGGASTTPTVPVDDSDCVLPEFPDASALPDLGMKLPDPFTFYDGTPVTTKAQWACRRKEILAMAAKYLYGPVPGDCDSVTGSVSGGNVSISCTVGSKTEDFTATISGSGKSINVDLSSGILPQGKKLSLGSGNDAKIKSLYGISELNPNIANGWMISRVMDVLEANPGEHDPKTIAVSGCSGCGKGAFLAGVFSRAPIVVIVESGGGGGSSWRMNEWFSHGDGKSRYDCTDRPQGIDVLEDTGICGPWVTGAASSFRSAPATVNKMPFDQHMLLATIAPRYLVHFSNDNGSGSWCWLGGTSEALASWAAHSVYNALGVPENHSFELYSGGHCGVGDTGIAANMFKRALDGDTSADTGKINISDSRVQVPMSEWKELFIDWDMDTILQ